MRVKERELGRAQTLLHKSMISNTLTYQSMLKTEPQTPFSQTFLMSLYIVTKAKSTEPRQENSESRIKNVAKDLRKAVEWSNMGFMKIDCCSHVSSGVGGGVTWRTDRDSTGWVCVVFVAQVFFILFYKL